ncbi:MAG: PTS transporter subunit EIIA [Anaerolineales bacterium]|nr:PTS transporter subunit EIIA [Anaerolineales bacterium]
MSWTNARLIIPRLIAEDSTQAIKILGGLLYDEGYVRDTFIEAVLEREKNFATGLPTSEIQIAIPHADIEHVIRPAIAVGVLERPITFGEMGNPDGTVDVKLVCMLAVTKSEALVSLLKNLVEIFQSVDLLQQIVKTDDSSAIAAIFNESLAEHQDE